MKNPYLSNDFIKLVNDHIAVGRGIDAFQDKFSALCVRNWELGIHDKLTADTILRCVAAWQAKIARGEVVPFRRARLRSGDIKFGRDLATPLSRPESIYLPTESAPTHFLLAGTTGSGKSTAVAQVTGEMVKAGVVVWQISCEKDDLRGQLPGFQRRGLDLMVVRLRDVKLNPLEPGGNEPHAHKTATTERLSRCLQLLQRSAILFSTVVHELFQRFGLFSGPQPRAPHLFHVYEAIRNRREENVAAKDALLARLGSFLESYTPACGAWLRGWTPTGLTKFNIAWEFRAGREDLKRFFVETLIEHVFQHAVEHGALNAKARLFVWVDDALEMVISAGQPGFTGVDRMLSILRSTGIGMGFLVQTPHGVSHYGLANIINRFLGRMADPDDWAVMGRMLDLNPSQLAWAKANLGPGRFVGLVTAGDWREPFAFEVERADLVAGVTDAEVIASQRPLDAIPVEFDENFRNWTQHPVLNVTGTPPPTAPVGAQPALTPAARRLTDAVRAEPGKPMGYYTRKLAMNGHVARAARELLVRLGIVTEHRLQLSPRGKPAIVLEPATATTAALTPTRP